MVEELVQIRVTVRTGAFEQSEQGPAVSLRPVSDIGADGVCLEQGLQAPRLESMPAPIDTFQGAQPSSAGEVGVELQDEPSVEGCVMGDQELSSLEQGSDSLMIQRLSADMLLAHSMYASGRGWDGS
ncbi:hypothetical protein VLY81_02075 [Geochorda subterranea]|uniref:Uncharacterized protein n=1 Tax=Geochorda subterranea TaxID=3109564 RepID=A0ABZ1BQL3_9FIRM|nr:hypothetical protein [Limnochorda sp. LNt]WRP14984.1 hypothetical protein VLY81_02075 [Limnochorda sp. LNt]